MNEDTQPGSQLFTLRLWPDAEEAGAITWRGKLNHVPSGEIRYFRDWTALLPLIMDMLQRGADNDAEVISQSRLE